MNQKGMGQIQLGMRGGFPGPEGLIEAAVEFDAGMAGCGGEMGVDRPLNLVPLDRSAVSYR